MSEAIKLSVFPTDSSVAPSTQPAPKRNPQSHHAYAALTLECLSRNGWRPVFHQGELYVLDKSAIWVAYDKRDLLRRIPELHDGEKNCNKWTDYMGIADQALSIAADASFFDEAPVGIACVGSFYQVDGAGVLAEPLEPGHRQRVALAFEPHECSTPQFDQFLHDTFRSEVDGEEAQQRRLVQEIAGSVLLGLMPRFHKAVLFYDPYGRAGKSTLESILRQLVPPEFTSAVSPFHWNSEYYLANLAGKRLNVVGELPDGVLLPAADFKRVIGGDMLAGRQPTKPVITFRNEAAHIFNSNHLIATREQTDALYARWLLVEFPNSLLVSGKALDSGLADRIIAQELPGIAHWALEGARRLLAQGAYSSSVVHDRLMAQWRRAASSIDEFIHECCIVEPSLRERRSSFYRNYQKWCKDNGRKPIANGRVKEQMEHRVGTRVRYTKLDGYEVIRGLAVLDAYRDELSSL